MTEDDAHGRPPSELSAEERERQGTHAHETRNWVFLHASAEQFAHHAARMPALEREYLARHPKRSWQGSGGAPTDPTATRAWREGVHAVIGQLEALLALPEPPPSTPAPIADPRVEFLRRIAAAPGGRLHKLEAHQVAREVGLTRADLSPLYTAEPALLVTDRQERVITDHGRDRVAQ